MSDLLPSISVVTPSYNQAEFLEETIGSVLGQNYPRLEYIIIDGGSDDGSIDIIRRYDSWIAYWVSEPDEGQADALSKGFAKATGEILCWIGSDDFFLPGALRAVGDYFLSHPTIEAVSAGCFIVDDEGKPLGGRPGAVTLGVAASYDRFRFYEQDGVFQPATFWRRKAYQAVGGIDPSFQFVMDLDLFLRLACRKPFGVLPQMLSGFRIHQHSKTSTLQTVRSQEQRRLHAIHGVFRSFSWLRRLLYWRYRIPSLVRKFYLWGLWRSGFLSLETHVPASFDRCQEGAVPARLR